MMSRQQRPSLAVLQKFTETYIRNNAPRVRWHDFDDKTSGYADYLETNSILLNPSIPRDALGCGVGGYFRYLPDLQLALEKGEQYFLVLLHEIGHFKITKHHRVKVPDGYKELKKSLNKRRLNKRLLDNRLELDSLIEEHFLEREHDEELVWGTIADFKSYYYTGDFTASHAAVEDWAIAEFQRQRQNIRAILGLGGDSLRVRSSRSRIALS